MKPNQLPAAEGGRTSDDDYALLLMLSIHKARDAGYILFAAALLELLRNHLADCITPARAGVGTNIHAEAS